MKLSTLRIVFAIVLSGLAVFVYMEQSVQSILFMVIASIAFLTVEIMAVQNIALKTQVILTGFIQSLQQVSAKKEEEKKPDSQLQMFQGEGTPNKPKTKKKR